MANIQRKWFDDIKVHPAEEAKLEFAVLIEKTMKIENLNRSELAKRIGKTPAWITKVLRGDANLTLETMCELVSAIGYELRLHISKTGTTSRWIDVYENRRPHEKSKVINIPDWKNRKEGKNRGKRISFAA